jgi:hypothetical protein
MQKSAYPIWDQRREGGMEGRRGWRVRCLEGGGRGGSHQEDHERHREEEQANNEEEGEEHGEAEGPTTPTPVAYEEEGEENDDHAEVVPDDLVLLLDPILADRIVDVVRHAGERL